jgi:assimilatory nitrate reductase catalytic subunit
VPEGSVFVPMHWSGTFASKARVGALVPAVTCRHSGQPALKAGRVEVRPWAAAWHGFAVSRRRPAPATDYWAVAPTPFGWRAELAGAARPDDWAAFARALFAAPAAEVVIVEDRARGSVRLALIEAGRLSAAFFAARGPVEVARAHVVAAFEASHPQDLLAGRPGAAQEDRGAIVCACFEVGTNTIARAIADGRVASVEALGALFRAGSNCGSCRPELRALLATHAPKIAAE